MRQVKYRSTVAVLLLAAHTATACAELPATRPATAFAIGPDGAVAVAFTTSPAPATVHVSALPLVPQPTDWLDERYAWDFGDGAHGQVVTDPRTAQPIDINANLTGPVAAYLYESAGTYTVTLTRRGTDGTVTAYHATVTVPPAARTTIYVANAGSDANPGTDPARPLATVAAAVARLADHTAICFRRGDTFPMTDAIPLKKTDLLVDCYGDDKQPLPTLRPTNARGGPPNNSPAFTTWPGQTIDVTVRHVRVDCPWTAAATAGGYAYHAPAGCFGTLRGRNVTVADCELGNVSQGPFGTADLAACLLLRVRQTEPTGVPGCVFWLEGRDVAAVGCTALNSVNECSLRAAATGVTRGLIALNDVGQLVSPDDGRAGAKAAVTLRTLADVAVVGNRVRTGEFSFDPRTPAAVDERVVAEANVVEGSCLHVKANVRHAVFRGNLVCRSAGPCVTVTPGGDAAGEYIDDVRLTHNAGCGPGDNGRLLQVDDHPPGTLRRFVADPLDNVYLKTAADH